MSDPRRRPMYHELSTEQQRDYWKEQWQDAMSYTRDLHRSRASAVFESLSLKAENELLHKQVDSIRIDSIPVAQDSAERMVQSLEAENDNLKARLAECRKTIEYLQNKAK